MFSWWTLLDCQVDLEKKKKKSNLHANLSSDADYLTGTHSS